MRNERDMLVRFQDQTFHLRPLLDEVNLGDWPALVLRYLDDDLLASCGRRSLTRRELKSVGKGVLKALEVLHGEGFVHTGKVFLFHLEVILSSLSAQTSNPAMSL